MRIFELNTHLHCRNFDEIKSAELKYWKALGFDAIWFMGVWRIGAGARRISKIVSEDYEGSPFAVHDYEFCPELGGIDAYSRLMERTHKSGLKIFLDFIPNHVALDSPWIASNPEFFILSDSRVRKQSTSDFFLHPSGNVVAFGRDPYFPPWHDTAQLDYSNAGLRARMISVLKFISEFADGVRCDMAMLILRDYFRTQWYPLAPPGWFDDRFPNEFWSEAISQIKATRPDFQFLAEAYWGKEPQLMSLGFDMAYEKELYDGLVTGNNALISQRLVQPPELLKRSLVFIENHDEPRAASIFEPQRNLAAAALILALPCPSLIYEGQMEGRRIRLPVQVREIPSHEAPIDTALRAAYEILIRVSAEQVFREGAFALFDTGNPHVLGFMRDIPGRTVVYLGKIDRSEGNFSQFAVDLTAVAQRMDGREGLRVTNLLTGKSALAQPNTDGAVLLEPIDLLESLASDFCLADIQPM